MGRWILAALVLALAVGAAAAYAYGADDRYEAVARVVVHPVPAGDETLAGIDVLRDSQDGERLLDTARAYFETPEVIAAAAARAGVTAGAVRKGVETRSLRGSNVLEIVGTATRGELAARLANAVAQEGVSQRTARFQAQVAAILSRLQDLGSVEARRRIVDLRGMQSRPDPTLETLSPAAAPGEPSWPKPEVVLPAGAGIGLGVAALVLLLPPLVRTARGGDAAALEDRERALERRAGAIDRRQRELAEAVAEARAETGGDRLDERTAAVTRREQAMARRAAELAQEERTLSRREEETARALERREQALREREQALAERERVLAERAQALDEREAALADGAQALEEREAAVAEREQAPPRPPPREPLSAEELDRPGAITIHELERLVDEQAASHPDRVEEWRYYLHFLREHADVDGNLPASFDYLVEETFAELLPR